MIQEKADLRNSALKRRDAMEDATRIEYSMQIADHGENLDIYDREYLSGIVIAAFLPIRSEVDARPLMANLVSRGARLCLPVVTDKTTIEFRELVRGAPLEQGQFGTLGPSADAQVLDPSILLMPLSVFDNNGGRIGYGGGYYDRAIEKLERKNIEPRLIGLAFSIQNACKVPMESHDRHLHGVITENGYHSFERTP